MDTGAALPTGNNGHFIVPLRSAGLLSLAPCPFPGIIAHRCLPSRRQQGGSLISVCAGNSGVISDALNTANSIAAHNCRIYSSYMPRPFLAMKKP
ncbi:MAG: hypothetical protein JNK48_03975 [Bryobacterales bacterium]|nr:hypothetical protein [Bryobacterales bacterium]